MPSIHELFAPARDQAAGGALPDGPFRGVPFLLKDLGSGTGRHALQRRAGVRRRLPLARHPDADAALHRRRLRHLRQDQHARTRDSADDGAPALRADAEPVGHRPGRPGGPPVVPRRRWRRAWCRPRTPTTAAAPSGFPPRAAAWSGLKPTRGRNSLAPAYGDLMGGLVAEHVVTRSVRDSAAILDATAGPVPGDPYWAPPLRGPSFSAAAAIATVAAACGGPVGLARRQRGARRLRGGGAGRGGALRVAGPPGGGGDAVGRRRRLRHPLRQPVGLQQRLGFGRLGEAAGPSGHGGATWSR